MSGAMPVVLRRMEKTAQKRAVTIEDDLWYQLRVAPSCPPDKQVHIRGGISSLSSRWGAILQDDFIPDTTCDFENADETQLHLNFTNANYYLGIILCFYGDWVAYRSIAGYEEPIFDCVVGDEVETAAEAEEQIDSYMNGNTQWYDYRLPLWGIVFKNDGVTGVDYSILPIGAVNRGKSYLYRDLRSRGGIFP